jgi:hypothetical protein
MTTSWLWMITLGGADAAILGSAICTMCLTEVAHHLQKALPLGVMVASRVAPDDWPVQIATGIPSYPTSSVPRANKSVMWRNTVTCLLPPSASNGT